MHHLVAGRHEGEGRDPRRSTTTRSTSCRPILDVLGVEAPGDDQGPHPEPLRRREHALQLRRRDGADDAARRSSTRCSARAAIWHDGWKAITTHPTISGWSHFNDDEWELYHTDVDRSELHNLAAEQPDKVRELVNLWYAEAGANDALPARRPLGARDHPHAAAACSRRRATATSTSPTPPRCPSRRRSTSATARSRSARWSTSRRPAPQGVLFAHGSRFGGHALYVKDNRLHYVYNFVGMFEQKVVAHRGPADRREPDPVGVVRQGRRGPAAASPPGILSLYHGDKKVGEGRIKTQPGKFMIAGEGLCVGRDGGDRGHRRLPGRAAVAASPAARSSGSPSTSAASRTSTSSARPQAMLMRE